MWSTYGVVEVSNPFPETVEIADVKRHLGLDHKYYDADLPLMVESSRRFCEAHTSLALAERQFLYTIDRFPTGNTLWLPASPLVSVESVTSEIDGLVTVWPASNYRVFSLNRPGGIQRLSGSDWPQNDNTRESIVVTFTAGYDAQNLPSGLRQGILMHVAYQFEYRGMSDPPEGILNQIRSHLDTFGIGDEFHQYRVCT